MHVDHAGPGTQSLHLRHKSPLQPGGFSTWLLGTEPFPCLGKSFGTANIPSLRTLTRFRLHITSMRLQTLALIQFGLDLSTRRLLLHPNSFALFSYAWLSLSPFRWSDWGGPALLSLSPSLPVHLPVRQTSLLQAEAAAPNFT